MEKNAPNPVKKTEQKKQHRNSKKTNELQLKITAGFFKTCVFYRSLVFYLIVIVVIAIAKPT
ncbi:hypothetical protein O59_003071 [Cellvibrio sp. BR]|nr:hypothetical protein O59_003071 [Cellvibrio sp. BR]